MTIEKGALRPLESLYVWYPYAASPIHSVSAAAFRRALIFQQGMPPAFQLQRLQSLVRKQYMALLISYRLIPMSFIASLMTRALA